MRIAAITMVGQFPDGVAPHVRNLRWALSEEDHIFIVTLPSIIKSQKLINNKRVTYIDFDCKKDGWVDFWRSLHRYIKVYSIKPEWFLFMESDIWFHKKPDRPPKDARIITSYLPTWSEYHNILLDGQLFHYRVWEGAQLVHGSIVKNAINFGIDFSFVAETFLHKNRKKYEKEFGGKISMSKYDIPDTMDEFAYYCALVEKTNVQQEVKAIHLRGPESIHRRFPELYKGNRSKIAEVQKAVPYIDIYEVIAAYYITGVWKNVNGLDWKKAKKETWDDLTKCMATGEEWMTPLEFERVKHVLQYRPG